MESTSSGLDHQPRLVTSVSIGAGHISSLPQSSSSKYFASQPDATTITTTTTTTTTSTTSFPSRKGRKPKSSTTATTTTLPKGKTHDNNTILATFSWDGENVYPSPLKGEFTEECQEFASVITSVALTLDIQPFMMAGWTMIISPPHYNRKCNYVQYVPPPGKKMKRKSRTKSEVLNVMRYIVESDGLMEEKEEEEQQVDDQNDTVEEASIDAGISSSIQNPSSFFVETITTPIAIDSTFPLQPLPIAIDNVDKQNDVQVTSSSKRGGKRSRGINHWKKKSSTSMEPVVPSVVVAVDGQNEATGTLSSSSSAPISSISRKRGRPFRKSNENRPIATPTITTSTTTSSSATALEFIYEEKSRSSINFIDFFSSLPIPTIPIDYEIYSNPQMMEVTRQLSSRAWLCAIHLKRPTDPFLIFRRVPAQAKQAKVVQTFVGRIEKAPSSVQSVDALEAWLFADRESHRSAGASNAAAEPYVGQDVLQRTVPADYACESLSVLKRLRHHPVLFHAGDEAANELVKVVHISSLDGGGGEGAVSSSSSTSTGSKPIIVAAHVKYSELAWSLSQAPHLCAMDCTSVERQIFDYYNIGDNNTSNGIATTTSTIVTTTTPTSSAKKRKVNSANGKSTSQQSSTKPMRTTMDINPITATELKDILSAPSSLLSDLDLGDILNFDTFAHELEPEDRAALYAMLPAPDVKSAQGVQATLDRNNHFTTSLILFQNLLRTGSFDAQHVGKARNKRRRMEGWTDEKERQVEAFYGQRLDPQPADARETQKWKWLDDEVVKLADRKKDVAVATPTATATTTTTISSSSSSVSSGAAPSANGITTTSSSDFKPSKSSSSSSSSS